MLMLGGALSVGIAFAGAPPSPSRPHSPAQAGASPTCEPDWSLTPDSNPGTQSNALEDVAAISATEFWAVGSSANSGEPARTLIQRWDGSLWNQVPSPSQAGSSYLKAVSVLSANDAWAVGHYQAETRAETFIVHWDGTQWSSVPSPNAEERPNFLTSVVAISTDDVWAVGHFYKASVFRYNTLTMHWDGTIWSIVSSPNGNPFAENLLNDITAVSANDVWAVGQFHPNDGPAEEALTLHWNGTSWSVVATPKAPEFGRTLNDVAAVSTNDVWAVGFIDGDPNHFEFDALILHWDGTAWTRIFGPTPTTLNELVGVAVKSANDIWAVGRYAPGSRTLIQHWDGATWRTFPSPSIEQNYNYLNGIAVAPGGNMMAVGTYTANNLSGTLAMRYPGAGCAYPTPTTMPTSTPIPSCGPAWRAAPNPGEGHMTDIAILSADDIWAVGHHGAQTSTGSAEQTYTMHWDGTNWSVISSPNASTFNNVLNGVAAISTNDVWAVGSYATSTPNQALLLFMHWDGANWTIVSSSIWGEMHDIVALSPTEIWAVGFAYDVYNIALILKWDGSNWNYYPIANIAQDTSSPLFGIAGVSANDIWAVGAYFGETLTAHWDGAQWNRVPSPNASTSANRLNSVSAISGDDVWAVGYHYNNGLPIRTLIEHWNGTAWSVVPSPNATSNENRLEAVAVAAPNDVWAVGYSYIEPNPDKLPHPALIEHWNGSEWSIFPAPNPGVFGATSLHGIAVTSPIDVWAVGKYENEGTRSLMAHYTTEPPCNTTPTPIATNTPPVIPSATPTACAITFSDVPQGNAFYPYVRCLACRGILGGYSDGTFRPNAEVTRGQLSKIVAGAAGFNENHTNQTFQDVPVGNTFHQFVERMASRGVIGGYPCGGTGELCGPGDRPYFRPMANATRGQISKIVSNSASLNDPPGSQAFQDVPPGSTFYDWVQRLAMRGVMGGYQCGAVGEPCGPDNLPYFRPNNNATRGQTSKIVAGAFFPNCQTPSTGTSSK